MYLFTQSALLKALGWSLLNSMWQMALLWLLYLLLRGLVNTFHHKSSSGLHHTLAILILGTGSAWSGVSFIRYMVISSGKPQGAQGILSFQALFSGERPESSFFGRIIPAFMDQGLALLSCLYLGILFFLLIRYVQQYRQSGLLRHRGLHKANPELRIFVDNTCRGLGIHKKVTLWLSSFVDAPLTIGFLKPLILLPVAILNNLDLKQVEAILLHELSHIKRNDYLLNLLMTVVQTLFFFNPFARLLIHSITREREHRCDDLVMQFRYDPHSYASALLLLARSGATRPQLAMAATGWDDRLLLQRVKRIMQQKSEGGRSLKKPVLFLLVASLAGLLSLFQSQQAPGSPGKTPYHAGRRTSVQYRILADRALPGREHGGLYPGDKTLVKITSKNKPSTHAKGHETNKRSGIVLVRPMLSQAFALPSVNAQIRDFSIAPPVDPILPREEILPGQPFVPPSSFSYLLTADENPYRNFTPGQVEQALQILAAIDWNKVEKKLSERGGFNTRVYARDLLQVKKQVFQKLLELSRLYRERGLGLQPDIKEMQKRIDSIMGRQLIIIHI